MAVNGSNFLVDDGIIVWFDGPEWDDVARKYFEDAAQLVKEQAQRNAPWEDRTGDARAGLSTAVENLNGDIVLTLYHTVGYGLWLEVIQSGRFAIIMPTLESIAPQIMSATAGVVANARKGRP